MIARMVSEKAVTSFQLLLIARVRVKLADHPVFGRPAQKQYHQEQPKRH